jgi:hypothetical protein
MSQYMGDGAELSAISYQLSQLASTELAPTVYRLPNRRSPSTVYRLPNWKQRNLESVIRDPQSVVRDPQSVIRNLGFSVM